MPGCWVGNAIRYRGVRSELITCMIIANQKPILIVGYQQGSSAQEIFAALKSNRSQVDIIEPDSFFNLDNYHEYQYIVSEQSDRKKRTQVIEFLDQNNLDLVTFIHDTAVVGQIPPAKIGAGSFVFPFCTLSIHSEIGRHCIVGSYSLIGHYSRLGNNCFLRPGVMINGKSSVGNNCVLNTRVTVTNKSRISDNIELMAFTNVTKNLTDPGKYIGSTARKFIPSDQPRN